MSVVKEQRARKRGQGNKRQIKRKNSRGAYNVGDIPANELREFLALARSLGVAVMIVHTSDQNVVGFRMYHDDLPKPSTEWCSSYDEFIDIMEALADAFADRD